MNPLPLHPALTRRVNQLLLECSALRAYRWALEWPQGHADRPPVPEHVRAFESAHGPLPASAERVLGHKSHLES
ncbi:MAG: hypothetical protein AB7J34_24925 [Limisphaerales bacterium]